ncbi:hypothetical protein TYRP_015415, partial [Tyrophagus putrescentiae]
KAYKLRRPDRLQHSSTRAVEGRRSLPSRALRRRRAQCAPISSPPLCRAPCLCPCPVPVPVPEPLSLDSRALAPICPERPHHLLLLISVPFPHLYRL